MPIWKLQNLTNSSNKSICQVKYFHVDVFKAMSSFIKIHPHYLMLIRSTEDFFSGELCFSLEQYGLILNNFSISLELTPPNQHNAHWRFICDDPGQLNVPSFVIFLKSIEHYIFSSLKFSPLAVEQQDMRNPNQPFRLFFEDMFFDINEGSLKKEPPKAGHAKK